MLKPLTTWTKTVPLVPYSGVQFLDFGFNIDDTRRIGRSFIERPDRSVTLPDGSIRLRFIPLTGDDEQDGPLLEQAVPDEAQYDVNKVKALEPFLNKWVPVPYLRVRPGRGSYGEELLDTGPRPAAPGLGIPARARFTTISAQRRRSRCRSGSAEPVLRRPGGTGRALRTPA
jgi:hypothetical protein